MIFTITNLNSEVLVLDIEKPEESGFLVRSVDGLGPVDTNLVLTPLTGIDGSLFNSASRHTRNIVFHLSFLGTGSLRAVDIRKLTYKYFPLTKVVKVEVTKGSDTYFIFGYIEKNEVEMFSRTPGCMISVICPDPYFYNTAMCADLYSTILPTFEFPWSNESLYEKLLVFGDLQLAPIQTVQYSGEIAIGFILRVHFKGVVENFEVIRCDTLRNLSVNSELLLKTTGSGFIIGDELIISSKRGQKYAYLYRQGRWYNILNCLGQNPTWFELEPGRNEFAYKATAGLVFVEVSIEYYPAHDGV